VKNDGLKCPGDRPIVRGSFAPYIKNTIYLLKGENPMRKHLGGAGRSEGLMAGVSLEGLKFTKTNPE
jgi:hypothetical protein